MSWHFSTVVQMLHSVRKCYSSRLTTLSAKTSKMIRIFSIFRSMFCIQRFLSRYEKAAQLYAQTEASFEEVALKFMEIKQEEALQTFLLEVIFPLQLHPCYIF